MIARRHRYCPAQLEHGALVHLAVYERQIGDLNLGLSIGPDLMAADRPNQYPCSPSAEQGSRKVFGMRYVHLHRPGFVAPPNSSQTAPYMVKSATDTATNIPSSLKMDFFNSLLKPHQSPSQNHQPPSWRSD